jgi:hypothetical protein
VLRKFGTRKLRSSFKMRKRCCVATDASTEVWCDYHGYAHSCFPWQEECLGEREDEGPTLVEQLEDWEHLLRWCYS